MSMTRDDALAQLASGLRKFQGFTAAQILESGWPGLKGLQTKDLEFFKSNGDTPVQEVAANCQKRSLANNTQRVNTSSTKKSIMFSALAQNYIHARTREENDVAWSASVNEGFKALKWISQKSLPDLSRPEWQIILNAYAGSIVSFDPPYRVASDLMDDFGVISLEILEPEPRALVEKIYNMSQAEQFAILDFVQKFWARNWTEDWNVIVNTIRES